MYREDLFIFKVVILLIGMVTKDKFSDLNKN